MTKNYTHFSKRSLITENDVLTIRRVANKSSVREIAANYDIPKSTVHDIITRKTWNHVPNPVTIYKNYSIYPDGRVWSNKSNQFMTQKLNREGVVTVELSVNGTRKTISVATLVAKAFHNSKSTKLSYVDGDKTNVHFTNITVR